MAPTSAPVVDTPVQDNTPIPVSEESHPTVEVTQPPAPTPVPQVSGPGDQRPSSSSPSGPGPTATVSSSPRGTSGGITLPPTAPPLPAVSGSDTTGLDGATTGAPFPGLYSSPVSAAAPAELSCQGKKKGIADPFLVAPYSGWADINSFLDHDSPDYAVDGTIVIANGLTATAGDGSASDFFPSYWSSALRQYISYDGHNGYDFGISYQPVLAAAAGTVSYAGWNGASPDEGYGQMILIDHHNGYTTLYGHLSKLEVKTGDQVEAGQEIGISGSTGNSTGPHLHFSVFHNCQVTDPYGWTGQSQDPLLDFNDEKASYLWLPGQEPLVLNPPPNWPTFPLGLKITLPAVRHGVHLGRGSYLSASRVIPPADRLLLLRLPAPERGAAVSPSVALARTETAVTQEAQALAPYLADLQAQGILQAYQAVPAAAAVWMRGTATAAQLEGLPGVASLAGGQPRDLEAAQVGLAHSILIQIGPEHLPSLWPVGFRSALRAWRPTAAVANGHALVTGSALPGERVVISLHRGGTVPGAAQALADPESGGYAAMLHDTSGNPVATRPGDIVQVECGGKTAQITILPFSLFARGLRVRGRTQPGVTVPLDLLEPGSGTVWKNVALTGPSGSFVLKPRRALTAGTLAVASVVDAAGNEESSTAFVPGIVIGEGSSTIRGWAVGDTPQVRVVRARKVLVQRRLNPAADGTFQIDLSHGGSPVRLAAGDLVTIGSRWHPRSFRLPSLSISLRTGATRLGLTGPARASVGVTYRRWDGGDSTYHLRLDAAGRGSVTWSGASTSLGDTATAAIAMAAGDVVQVTEQARGIVIQEGDSLVSGRVRPDVILRMHLATAKSAPLGGAVAVSDPATGKFSARLVNAAGAPVLVEPSTRVDLQDGTSTTIAVMPRISAWHTSRSWGVGVRVPP
ncbi:MAG: M23 family metallopeptidase, partial [Chloroflexi bacterium]|nr:M23 family metallopeptidase [Chloroflexota bacterium]